MANENLLPIDALVPGGKRYDEFQPDRFTSVMVRSNVAAVIDMKGDLSLYRVEPNVPKLNVFSSRFPYDQLHGLLEEEVKSVKSLKISGMSVSESNVSLFLQVEKSLIRLDLCAEELKWSLVWRVDTTDWVLVSTNGEGDYLFASRGKEEINYMDASGDRKVIYTEKDSSFTVRKTPSRQEFGIEEMFFLSPDKTKVAFYRLNEKHVTEFPLVMSPDGSSMPGVKKVKYPLAGTENPELVQVGILDLKDGHVVFLEDDDEICYWIGLTWAPDSQSLFSFVLNRRQQRSRLLQFNASSGALQREILCEESKKYVEPQCSLHFVDDERFLFQTRSYSGYNHIYLFDLKSNSLNQITQGSWEVTSLLGYSSSRDIVVYLATKNSPLNRDFFATRLSDGVTTQLSDQLGTHQVYMDAKGPVWVDVFNSMDTPNVTSIGSLDTYGDLLVLKRSSNPYEGYEMPERIVGVLPKADASDDDIYYRIVQPRSIKDGERLPVVLYVYGGPHVQLITNSWGSGTKGFEEMMANSGCVTFCIDPHGSYNRGFAFESLIRDDLNGPQIRDNKYALNWLFLTHGYVDRNRVAVYGWSFGGFMTLSMLLCGGFPFKVGVAGGAVVSWRYYETMYTERYMSLDDEGRPSGDHFERTDMAKRISDLKSPLYLIHCLSDSVVLPLHPQYLLAEANKRNDLASLVDCYYYPGHAHNVVGEERVHLMEKIKSIIFSNI